MRHDFHDSVVYGLTENLEMWGHSADDHVVSGGGDLSNSGAATIRLDVDEVIEGHPDLGVDARSQIVDRVDGQHSSGIENDDSIGDVLDFLENV